MTGKGEFDMRALAARYKAAEGQMHEKGDRKKARKYFLEAAEILKDMYFDVSIGAVCKDLKSCKGGSDAMSDIMAEYYTWGPLCGAEVYPGIGIAYSDMFMDMSPDSTNNNRLWKYMLKGMRANKYLTREVNILFKMRRGKHLWIMTRLNNITTAPCVGHITVPSKGPGAPDIKMMRVDQIVYERDKQA